MDELDGFSGVTPSLYQFICTHSNHQEVLLLLPGKQFYQYHLLHYQSISVSLKTNLGNRIVSIPLAQVITEGHTVRVPGEGLPSKAGKVRS